MKKYDVFGIGNALVDIEYRIAIEELESFDLPKGIMTLVPASRQKELLSKKKLKSKED